MGGCHPTTSLLKTLEKKTSRTILWSTSCACHEFPLSELKRDGSASSTRTSDSKDFNQYWMNNLTQRRSCAMQNLSQWSTSDEIDQTWFLKGYDPAISTDKKCKERQWIPLHSKPIEKCYLSSASFSTKNTENQVTMAQSVEHATTAWKVAGSIPGQHHLFDPNSETSERIGLKRRHMQAFDITLASVVIITGDKNNT